MGNYLAIDIGGTRIKYAVLDEEGQFLQETASCPTPDNRQAFLAQLQTIIEGFSDLAGLAFSLPGKVDTQTGTVSFGGSLPYLDGLCLKEIFADKVAVIAVQNDAKAAAQAELWLGNLRGVSDGVALILGTGVGGGVVLDGKLRLGSHFQAGEVSMMVTDYAAAEAVAAGRSNSAVAFVRRVNSAVGNSDLDDGKAAFAAIHAGQSEAREIFQAYCRSIAYQILTLQAALDVTTYVIGGGISAQPILLEEIKAQFASIGQSHPILEANIPKDLAIRPAKFGNDANLYGALYNLLVQEGMLT
ncbi:ROK family protein [Streptococcus sp. DD12]|uniref:ROK family protein n=1 Tax=Streptococcus sp. DD12 TaxID=1777880 RepID=UPI0007930F7F|nr:ROK family protein [Streptococcus sp. DD12]KXT76916.1 Sugar kinase and transcription regulator [Streptococcus sp. DD12]